MTAPRATSPGPFGSRPDCTCGWIEPSSGSVAMRGASACPSPWSREPPHPLCTAVAAPTAGWSGQPLDEALVEDGVVRVADRQRPAPAVALRLAHRGGGARGERQARHHREARQRDRELRGDSAAVRRPANRRPVATATSLVWAARRAGSADRRAGLRPAPGRGGAGPPRRGR